MTRVLMFTLMALWTSQVIASAVEYVSLAALISVPEKFDGKRIITAGYLQPTHTSFLLMLHEDDAKHMFAENSVGIQGPSSEVFARLNKRQANYVRVKGTFHSYKQEKVVVLRGYIEIEDVVLPNETFIER